MRNLFIAAAFLFGCGDSGADLTGMYMTTSSAIDESSCGPGMPTNTPTYFRVAKDQGPTVLFYEFDDCTSADPSTCTGDFAMPLQVSIPNGWQGAEAVAGMNNGACVLSYIPQSATLDSGSLRFERHTYSEGNVQGAACTTAEAKSRGMNMPCTGYQLLVGNRVGN